MSQWKIFSDVFTPEKSENSRVMIMVGDPKQAIYRFRGADVSAYIGAVNQPGVTRHNMTVNWRSDADLIAALNQLMQGCDFGQGRIPYIQVAPRANAAATSLRVGGKSHAPLEIRWVPREGVSDFVAPTARAAISSDLANYVYELITKGTLELGNGDTRRVRAGDIAILMRGNEDSKFIRDDLRALNIPVVEARVGGVNESEAFDQIEILLNVLVNVSDPRRIRSLVFTWFTDMVLEDLADESIVEALQQKCAKWADDMATEGISYMYEQLRSESDVMRLIARSDTPARHLTDLEHIFELLSSASDDRAVAPSVAVRHLDSVKNADKESDTLLRRTETDADAVQITSMHSSKGLEYPIVLLPIPKAPSSRSPHVYTVAGERFVDSAPKVKWVNDAHGSQDDRKMRAQTEEAEDEARLIYVALTRARHQLTIWWASTQRADQGSLGKLLFRGVERPAKGEIPDADVRRAFGDLVAESNGCITYSEIPFQGRLIYPPLEVESHSQSPTLADSNGLQTNDYTWARWSYSSLTKDQHATREEKPRGGTDEDYSEESLITPVPSSDFASLKGGAEFGTYVHKVMEEVDFCAEDLEAEIESVIADMTIPEFINNHQLAVIDGIAAAIRTPLAGIASGASLQTFARKDRLAELRFDMSLGGARHAQLAKIASRAALEKESPFAAYFSELATNWRDRYAAGFLTGSIDALLRVQGADQFVIVDYKSNMLGRSGIRDAYGYESMRNEMEDAGYPLQALLYCVATHRYLKARLSGYDIDKHLAGCGYLFMRGMVGAETPVRDGITDGVFTWRPSSALVIEADELLGGSNG